MKKDVLKKVYKKSGKAMGWVSNASLQLMRALDTLREVEGLYESYDYIADGSIGPVVTDRIAEAEDMLDRLDKFEELVLDLFEEIQAECHGRGIKTHLVKVGC